MFTSRHAVFVGPGKLNDELRQVLAKRAGALHPDIAVQVPRLLGVFESAADAERVAAQVQRLKLGAVVSGPEQPPAELSWTVATSIFPFDKIWRLTSTTGESHTLDLATVTAVTWLDWRPDEAAADRAALLTVRDARPVMLRAKLLDDVSPQTLPLEGMKRINEVLDALALVLPQETKVRARKLNEQDLRGGELTGDLLPLALAVVDLVDTLPGALPQPLTSRPRENVETPPHYTGLSALTAWVLFAGGLTALVGSLAFLTVAATQVSVLAGALGLALGAWGTRRYMWARWLAGRTWGAKGPVPSWPIAPGEPGIEPGWLELAIDAFIVIALAVGAFDDHVLRALSLAALGPMAIGSLASVAAVYEAWQRE